MMDPMDASEADQLKTDRGTLSDIWGGFILPKRQLDNVPAGKSRDEGPPRINVRVLGTHQCMPPRHQPSHGAR